MLFVTVGGVEGLSKVSTGTLQTFSEQQLIDCVLGCTGGWIDQGYNYYKTHCKILYMQLFALLPSIPLREDRELAKIKHAPLKYPESKQLTPAMIWLMLFWCSLFLWLLTQQNFLLMPVEFSAIVGQV